SPSGDTNDAVQPPSDTTALSGEASGSDSVLASIGTPMLWNVSTWNGNVICWGSHMPPGLVDCSRNPRPGSAAAGGAEGSRAVPGDAAVSWAGAGCPATGPLLPLPQPARTSPHRIAVCFMPDSIPRIGRGTKLLAALAEAPATGAFRDGRVGTAHRPACLPR